MNHTPVKWILALSILMILVYGQTARSQATRSFRPQMLSGNDLVEPMREYDRFVDSRSEADATAGAIAFLWYVKGVCEGVVWLENVPEGSGTTGRQAVTIVSKYLKDHPEKWGEPAVSLVIEALKETFPLKRPAR